MIRSVVSSLVLAALTATAYAADTPNVVIILSDDLGYGSVGCYGADKSLVRTPNIDRLAKEGRRFTDANTPSSVCSPTRYGLLTGRYCWRTSLEHEVLSALAPLHIETTRLNLASMLKSHGYTAAAIGKWHLGYGTKPRVDFTKELSPGPLDLGFDYHFALPSNHGDISGVFVENRGVAGLRSDKLNPTAANFKGTKYLGLDAPQRVDDEVMDVLTDKAVGWIEAQSADKPFFLYFTPVAVHNPITPSKHTRGTSKAGPYGDFLHDLDRSVGRILDTLDQKGLADNTLVVFTSDNGGRGAMDEVSRFSRSTDAGAPPPTPEIVALSAGLDFNRPWRGRKHSVYQGGFCVPFLVRWPGKVPAGTVCDEMISLVDLPATIAAVVGHELPPADVAAEDSVDVLPALLGESYEQPLRRDMIVHSADGNFAIRDGRWKYILGNHHPATKPAALRSRSAEFKPQLYDLDADPGETTDVSAKHPEEAQRLSALLESYRKSGHSRP